MIGIAKLPPPFKSLRRPITWLQITKIRLENPSFAVTMVPRQSTELHKRKFILTRLFRISFISHSIKKNKYPSLSAVRETLSAHAKCVKDKRALTVKIL